MRPPVEGGSQPALRPVGAHARRGTRATRLTGPSGGGQAPRRLGHRRQGPACPQDPCGCPPLRRHPSTAHSSRRPAYPPPGTRHRARAGRFTEPSDRGPAQRHCPSRRPCSTAAVDHGKRRLLPRCTCPRATCGALPRPPDSAEPHDETFAPGRELPPGGPRSGGPRGPRHHQHPGCGPTPRSHQPLLPHPGERGRRGARDSPLRCGLGSEPYLARVAKTKQRPVATHTESQGTPKAASLLSEIKDPAGRKAPLPLLPVGSGTRRGPAVERKGPTRASFRPCRPGPCWGPRPGRGAREAGAGQRLGCRSARSSGAAAARAAPITAVPWVSTN